jgi:hypothetical protein
MCRSRAEGGRRCPGTGSGAAARDGSGAMPAPGTGTELAASPPQAGESGPPAPTPGATAAPQDRPGRPRLTPPQLAALRWAAAHPKGSFPPLAARTEEALEQRGYAASIDDCGHINTGPADTEHRFHPHFLRITPAGRAAITGLDTP